MMSSKQTPIQIRFNDIDLAGHVNNAVYLQYFEIARIDFFMELTRSGWDWVGDGIILAKNEVEYKRPVTIEDQVVIHTSCSRIGSKSFELNYELYAGDELCTSGKSTQVCMDFEAGRTQEIPARMREFLEAR